MRNFVYLLLFMLITSTTVLHTEVNLYSEQQINYLIDRAHFFAQHGISQEEILHIFEQSLTHEELCNKEPEKLKSRKNFVLAVIISALCIAALGIKIYVLKCEANLATMRLNLIRNRQQLNQEIAHLNQENFAVLNQEIAQARERVRLAEKVVYEEAMCNLWSYPQEEQSQITNYHNQAANERREAQNLLHQAEARANNYRNLQHQLQLQNLHIPPIPTTQTPFNGQEALFFPIAMALFPPL